MAFPKQKVDAELAKGMGVIPHGKSSEGCINDMMVCSYDESHVVSAGRYHAHLKNCRARAEQERGASYENDEIVAGIEDDRSTSGRSEVPGGAPSIKSADEPKYTKDEMKICPFDPAHHVHDSVMEKHIILCDAYFKWVMDIQVDPPAMKDGGNYDFGDLEKDADWDQEGMSSGSEDSLEDEEK